MPDMFPDAPNRSRLRGLASMLSASSVDHFGFEWPLWNLRPAFDFAVQLNDRGYRFARSGERFAAARDFIERAASLEACDAHNTWLEWDASAPVARSNHPSVYVTVLRDRLNDVRELDAILELPSEALMVIASCIDVVPMSARHLHAGRMFQRDGQPLRLGLSTLTLDESIAVLGAIECDALDTIAALLREFADDCDGFGVQLEWTGGKLRALGFELVFTAAPIERQPDREPRWFRLLERLLRMGCLQPQQTALLLAWPSRRVLTTSDGSLSVTFATGLQHVKLVTGDGRSVRAKAYFGAAFFRAG